MDKACNVMEEQYRVEAKKAFEELRKQAVDVPEMSLDEINEEIKMLREERKYILQKSRHKSDFFDIIIIDKFDWKEVVLCQQ